MTLLKKHRCAPEGIHCATSKHREHVRGIGMRQRKDAPIKGLPACSASGPVEAALAEDPAGHPGRLHFGERNGHPCRRRRTRWPDRNGDHRTHRRWRTRSSHSSGELSSTRCGSRREFHGPKDRVGRAAGRIPCLLERRQTWLSMGARPGLIRNLMDRHQWHRSSSGGSRHRYQGQP